MRIQTDVGMSYSSEPPDPGGEMPEQTGETTAGTPNQQGEATSVASRQRMWLNLITYLQVSIPMTFGLHKNEVKADITVHQD